MVKLMNNYQKMQQILQHFGKQVALDSLKLNDEGSCRLFFDNEVEINLELDDATDSLLLISPIVKANEALYADMLELNLFWGQLKGCRFILLKNAGVLALMRRLSVKRLDQQHFEKTLETFLETVSIWKKAFEDSPKKEQHAACGWNPHSISGSA